MKYLFWNSIYNFEAFVKKKILILEFYLNLNFK